MTTPIDMVLHCPSCGHQHIDAVEHDEHGNVTWPNDPHRSHKCHACPTVWRPADVPTNGVRAISTRGQHDTYPRL